MKRFSFRLERLRRLREATERERAKVLGEAMNAEAEQRAVLESWINQRNRAKTQVSRASNAKRSTMEAGTLTNLGFVADTCGSRVGAAESECRLAEERTDAERQNFEEARKDRRVLDRLRERQWSKWMYEASREEQAAVDEVAARNSGSTAGGNR